VDASVPPVEVADDADARRVGRPDSEVHAVHAPPLEQVRAELVVDARVAAFAEEVEIEIGEDTPETVGILDVRRVSARVGDAQPIRDLGFLVQDRLVDPGRMALRRKPGGGALGGFLSFLFR